MSAKIPNVISEDEARQILVRATALEGQRRAVSLEELRSVALEAGIEPTAIEAAIDDVVGAGREIPAATPSTSGWNRFVRRAAVGIVGLAGGTVTWLLAGGDPYGGDALGLGIAALIAGSAKLLMRARESRDQEQFQTDLFLLWSGFTAGWSITRGESWTDMTLVAAMLWAACAIAGGLIVHFKPKRTSTAATDVVSEQ